MAEPPWINIQLFFGHIFCNSYDISSPTDAAGVPGGPGVGAAVGSGGSGWWWPVVVVVAGGSGGRWCWWL